ncbi:ferritin [Arcticibacter tournemirensis]|uniref:Ferritin n=1 Tax=Arcticibacter tournemirensis TaxID=699437 RepID=A0A4Q0MGE9_9SPHI|nr:ferritin [Arcticibacter tournemirensis]KAA8477142.1 ferritin [Arcticibacter tournemirensis]RXF72333.1 ferritin [Arcticibacter tournemirensis]TQM51212.1 ferritin [Arcticibacter tournemirensis]
MKDLLRLRTSLSEEIEVLLNEQIKMEAYSSAVYLSMSSWCNRNGFDNSASYLEKQSGEEREHMLKIFRFVNDMGGRAISPEITNIPQEFESFKGVFEMALQQEINVTASFNRIADRCFKVKDFMTFQFLQWFLNEQREEEYVARRILELFDVIGEEGTGRWQIDKTIPSVSYTE